MSQRPTGGDRLHVKFQHAAAHGVRTVDNLRNFCGVQDPIELEVSPPLCSRISPVERCILERSRTIRDRDRYILHNQRKTGHRPPTWCRLSDGRGVPVLYHHLFTLLTSSVQLTPGRKHPKPCWAICTSATRTYASAAVSIAGVPVPDVFVVAEDVERGKP